MGFDGLGDNNGELDGAFVKVLFAIGHDIAEIGVGIGDGGLVDVFIDTLSATLVAGLEFDFDAGAAFNVPFDDVILDDIGPVFLGVDTKFVMVGLGTGAGFAV